MLEASPVVEPGWKTTVLGILPAVCADHLDSRKHVQCQKVSVSLLNYLWDQFI